jgi:excisionase family DNA binding protein
MTDQITTAEAAQHFNVSERTIRRWIKDGKLRAEWASGQWAVRLDERTSESPSVRGDDRADGRLAEQRQSDIDHLRVELEERKSQLQQANLSIQHISERLKEKECENRKLHGYLARRDDAIESLTREVDHLTQLLAVQTKTNTSLTDRLQAIEDLRHRPWWRRLFRRT